VKEEAEGVAILADPSVVSLRAWPACAAARRFGEVIIRTDSPHGALKENLNRDAILKRPRLAKVLDPMFQLCRLGNNGAHTERTCYPCDVIFVCHAVADCLRGLYS
jgi:hypothetical protein